MTLKSLGMVRLKFSGRSLHDADFWTTSDPFLVLSRPARNGPEWVQVRVNNQTWILNEQRRSEILGAKV